MSVVATYVVFNEAPLIAESIRSIKNYVDRIVVVDSAFLTNPVDATHSTDGTKEVAEHAAEGVPLTYVESDRKLALAEARNLSHSLLDERDWALTIDGDETLLGNHADVSSLFVDVKRGAIPAEVGISVFTAAVAFQGQAPDISEVQYGQLPIIHTRGVQPRLFPVRGVTWGRVETGRRTYAMFRRGEIVMNKIPDPRAVLVNHRIRQSYEVYQSDYVWEMAETGPR